MVFEIVSTLTLLAIMIVITWTSVRLIDTLEGAGVSVIPAAWLTTAWQVIATLALSTFTLKLVQLLLGA